MITTLIIFLKSKYYSQCSIKLITRISFMFLILIGITQDLMLILVLLNMALRSV